MVSCRYHLYLDVAGVRGDTIVWNFPSREVEDMPESCALDVADRGGAALEEIAGLMNMSRERVRQLEVRALERLLRKLTPGEREAFVDYLRERMNEAPSFAEAEGENGGGEDSRKSEGRASDFLGEEFDAEADAWAEEVAGLYLEGVPLREAQALVDARETARMPRVRPADGTRVPSYTRAGRRAGIEAEKARIVEYLRGAGSSGSAAIRAALGIPRSRLDGRLLELRRAGVLEHDGWREHSTWKLRGAK